MGNLGSGYHLAEVFRIKGTFSESQLNETVTQLQHR